MMRKGLSAILLICFYLIFFALVVEAGVRLAGAAPPAAPSGWFWRSPDPVTGWSHLPGVAARSFNPFYEFDVQVTLNSRGIRGPETLTYARTDGVYRVLLLGDSFMEALQVNDDETLGEVLRSHLQAQLGRPVEVINSGVSGFGTDQELLWLREEGVKYAPDLVLLAVYPHNDFMNNAEVLESANQGAISKPFFALADGQLQLHYYPYDPASVPPVSSPFAEVAQTEMAPGPLTPLADWLRPRSAFYRYFDPRIRIASPRTAAWLARTGLLAPGQESQLVAQGAGFVPLTYRIYQNPLGPEWQQAVALTTALFGEIRTTAESIGAQSAALVIPSPETVYPARWQQILTRFPAMQSDAWDLQQPERLALTALADAGIPAHSLATALARGAANAPLLYFAEEGHWTAAGHRLAALDGFNFLQTSGLISGLAGPPLELSLPRPVRTPGEWMVLAILLVIALSLLWEMWKLGPRRWLRNVGVGLATVGELLMYMARQRQFALLPLLILLLTFAGLLVLAQASVVGPFIYTLI
ncbi:MAG: SGNH/GDSL hydrolase family protein [Caldilineaceae bacterium]|nr:SGNH/GDSL hydrolase family protein [Caldilineaceae bacterium]